MTQARALTRARAGRPLRPARSAEQQGGLDWARRIELASVLIASLVAVVGLWYSNVQNREANDQARQDRSLSKEGQITDRYTAAVTNLGDETLDVRLGGIYALQRIMKDSPRDHPTIANVLAAYIRTHASKPPAKDRPIPADVNAALAVLADRNPNRDGKFALDLRHSYLPGVELRSTTMNHRNRTSLAKADLRASHLTSADLYNADLREANLDNADLRNARLTSADLSDAHLAVADLRDADLRGADLRDAFVYNTDLSGADLRETNLHGAFMGYTDLRGVDLRGVDLRRTLLLEAEDLVVAFLDSHTKLPPDLAKHPAVRARIAALEGLH
ncbi:pentapeptide repeat-containing protein [Streptomyces sp. HUCO-GS316]|uniref:pentapeptide repeat-containing protein n=1 Tax=Streptomyces sp. HUCO-GS316 TaxID=2692198 RepID=UPI00301E2430